SRRRHTRFKCDWSSDVCSSDLDFVPTPQSYFGHEIGQDRTVLDWSKVAGYFHELAKSSDRIRVEELGKTADNRPFLAATIADPEIGRASCRERRQTRTSAGYAR